MSVLSPGSGVTDQAFGHGATLQSFGEDEWQAFTPRFERFTAPKRAGAVTSRVVAIAAVATLVFLLAFVFGQFLAQAGAQGPDSDGSRHGDETMLVER